MREIIENGIEYMVSDNYPTKPYQKYVKSNPYKTALTAKEFRALLSFQQQIDIISASKTNPVMEAFCELYKNEDYVELTSDAVQISFSEMVRLGIMSEEEANGKLRGIIR